jgi:hypothetical protein
MMRLKLKTLILTYKKDRAAVLLLIALCIQLVFLIHVLASLCIIVYFFLTLFLTRPDFL